MIVWVLLALLLLAQGMFAVGMLGILVSAFSSSFRERLNVFVMLVFIGIVLYLVTSWTALVWLSTYCPGGGCT